MKKAIGMFVALILALGMTGVAFAHWSQILSIEGTVKTGELCVGIRDVGTSDPGTTLDKMFDSDTATIIQLSKDVGKAESLNGVPKCMHLDMQYYEDITFTVTDAYPQYYWEEEIKIANCGDIPVKLASIEYWDYIGGGGWTNLFGANSYALWSDPLSDDIWTGSYSLDFPHDTVRTGTWYHELMADLVAANTQLDPCDVATIKLGYFLYEDAASIPEMNATSTMKLRVTFTQWNKVP